MFQEMNLLEKGTRSKNNPVNVLKEGGGGGVFKQRLENFLLYDFLC